MRGPSTTVVHADREHHPDAGLAPAIHQTAAFASASDAELSAAAAELRGERFYTRYGNPNHAQVAEVVADLEGAEAGLVTASGMAALATCVLALVEAGDHVVGQLATYGGTAALIQQLLPRVGITYTQVDQTDVAAFEAAMTPRTKLVLLESPSNPLLKVTDLEAVAALASVRGALTLADNTFASPINQTPLGLGVDIVWHSATKYLNGHGDVSAGVIAGRADHLDRIAKIGILTGATLGPVDSWLLLRGLRTLPLRMQRHNANALALARALDGHPAVSAVHYPGLESSPQHALASRQMSGFGGVLAFELEGGEDVAIRVLEGLELARISASLGSPGTLAIRPAAMWSGTVDEEALAAAGVGQGLIRVAAGLEDTDDLVADVLNALDRSAP
jgi:methionine-gamma-lyase